MFGNVKATSPKYYICLGKCFNAYALTDDGRKAKENMVQRMGEFYIHLT
jgi:hypothetical protein